LLDELPRDSDRPLLSRELEPLDDEPLDEEPLKPLSRELEPPDDEPLRPPLRELEPDEPLMPSRELLDDDEPLMPLSPWFWRSAIDHFLLNIEDESDAGVLPQSFPHRRPDGEYFAA
jgi:hypothetical protein